MSKAIEKKLFQAMNSEFYFLHLTQVYLTRKNGVKFILNERSVVSPLILRL